MAKIIVVDDEVSIRRALEKFLTGLGHTVFIAGNGEDALLILEKEAVDLALVDLVMPNMDGTEFIRRLKREQPEAVAIVLTGFGTITSAVEAMKAGAYHYLTKPFELDDIATLIETALEHKQLKVENTMLKHQLQERYQFENIIGTSEGMGEVFDLIEKVAETDSTILILGESGTGKELIAKAIHYNSFRKGKPLVAVNCAAIPGELLESELFGHVKGSFTGAVANKLGKFTVADKGTIFLDEIGDMDLNLQVKMLRVLQEKSYEPVGSNKNQQVDVRIVAATNQNLEQAVAEKRFREDLFYRLNVIPLQVPPLRERKCDIPLLVRHFIKKYNTANESHVSGISDDALNLMLQYRWPGNVRELENTIERSLVLRREGSIQIADLPPAVRANVSSSASAELGNGSFTSPSLPSEGLSFKLAVENFESNLILQALERTNWNKNQAATLLQLNRTTLVEKIKKRHIERDGMKLD